MLAAGGLVLASESAGDLVLAQRAEAGGDPKPVRRDARGGTGGMAALSFSQLDSNGAHRPSLACLLFVFYPAWWAGSQLIGMADELRLALPWQGC
jgi:hypothetical protein